MKYIKAEDLIKTMAKNLKNDFSIEEKKIASNITGMLNGVVSMSTVLKYLPDNFKKNNVTKPCPFCGKRISRHKGRMTYHINNNHKKQKKIIS